MDTAVAIVVVVVVIGVIAGIAKAVAESKAKTAYQKGLAELERNPTDAVARKRALELGRTYANLTRNGKGVALFDEVALSNDINAVSGGKTAISGGAPPPPAASAQPSVASRLSKLKQLHDAALITDEEYVRRRKEILDQV